MHVTNGDSVIYLFKKAGILGTHVPWRDVLHEGPVPAGLTLEELSQVRGTYLASRGHGKPIKLLHDFSARDATIRRAREYEEVTLWFEHDLYDQLQLLQILVTLDDMQLEPGRVQMVQSDAYLGSMTAEEIGVLYPKRRTITAAMYSAARRAWEAFTAAEPTALAEVARIDAAGLPFLRSALVRLCEEYPWRGDGLSRSQRHALSAAAQSPARNEELFRRAQSREEAMFLGDSTFYAILEDLRAAPWPLLEEEDGALVPTALGRRVLAGDADWIEVAGIDRWIGGVHLQGTPVARFDEVTATLIAPSEMVP